MSERFTGKVALVTGAASGMGECIVRNLVAEGASVVAVDINGDGVAAVAATLGGRCVAHAADVTREADCAAAVATAVSTFGGLDVAYNVAGSSRLAALQEMSEADWDFTVDICLKGVFLGMKHQARQLIAQGRGGAIVNIASANSTIAMIGNGPYCAAKAGVAMLSKCGALEWGPYGIRVNTISPGLTATPLASVLIDLEGPYGAFLQHAPLGTHGTPQDMADAALFLTSDAARFITGVNLGVDGGIPLSAYPDIRPWLPEIAARVEADSGGA